MLKNRQFAAWALLTLLLIAYLGYSLVAQPSNAASTFLPGVTTHGHYQIELQCKECHSPGMGVLQDACTRCHAAELKRATDTHPKTKFADPGKAHLLKNFDARSCTACHQEHVPDRTMAMGLSLPADYCWHCHQEIGEQRPSHKDLAYDSCATAGCHNYHDNRALYEPFLVDHYGEDDMLDTQLVPLRTLSRDWLEENDDLPRELTAADQNAPKELELDKSITSEWAETAHAAAGVNCSACHTGDSGDWFDHPTHDACKECHAEQVEGFLGSRHGMRLAVGLSPMQPSMARLPMNHDSLHKQLSCVACHGSHRFDTAYAAVEACLQCHKDEHSLAYKASPHYELWQLEQSGEAQPGSGVSCATCHLPRTEEDGRVVVQHNQNDYLRPNDKMLRPVCGKCHGLEYSIDALADENLVKANFSGQSEVHVESVEMAKAWADERERKRAERKKKQELKRKKSE